MWPFVACDCQSWHRVAIVQYFFFMSQADAMTDFLLQFNWTYVSLIFSEGPYGENGAKQVRKARVPSPPSGAWFSRLATPFKMPRPSTWRTMVIVFRVHSVFNESGFTSVLGPLVILGCEPFW